MWCGKVWCGVVKCGEVWCGVVKCSKLLKDFFQTHQIFCSSMPLSQPENPIFNQLLFFESLGEF